MRSSNQINLFIIFSILCCVLKGQQNPFLCPKDATNNMVCNYESGQYSDYNISQLSAQNLKMTAYNIDRNGYGGDGPNEQGLDKIIALFDGPNATIPNQDVIVISELARDCPEWKNQIDGPQEIAQRLKMNYVYVVEYIDFSGVNNNSTTQCTIGNGIFSKYPLTNIKQLRFQHQCCIFGGRIGGRIGVSAFIEQFDLAVYSIHLESGQSSFLSVVESAIIRGQQSSEIRDHAAANYPNKNIVVAGDFNEPIFGDLDPVIVIFKFDGYSDAHYSLPYSQRCTTPFDDLSKYYLYVFDYILIKSSQLVTQQPQICNQQMSQQCYGVSDHYPIMVEISKKSSLQVIDQFLSLPLNY